MITPIRPILPTMNLSPCVFHAALSVAESPPLYYVTEHRLHLKHHNNKYKDAAGTEIGVQNGSACPKWVCMSKMGLHVQNGSACPKWVCIAHDFYVAPLYISDCRLVDLLLAPLEAVPKERKKIPLTPVPSRAATSLEVLWTYLPTYKDITHRNTLTSTLAHACHVTLTGLARSTHGLCNTFTPSAYKHTLLHRHKPGKNIPLPNCDILPCLAFSVTELEHFQPKWTRCRQTDHDRTPGYHLRKAITCSVKPARNARARWRYPSGWPVNGARYRTKIVTSVQGGKKPTAKKIYFLQAPVSSFVTCELFSVPRSSSEFWHQ